MQVTAGVVLLLALVFAWKMKGAQLPHLFLGVMVGAARIPIVDSMAAMGTDLVMTIVRSVAGIFQGGGGGTPATDVPKGVGQLAGGMIRAKFGL